MQRLLAWFLAALLSTSVAHAADVSYIPGTSTPNISISGSSSTNVTWDGGPVDYIYIKNDCSSTLYFDLRLPSQTGSFPLRLAQNQSFEAPFKVKQLGVSTSAGNGTTCTFTLMIGRH
jgi:hypothetical protein